MLGEDGHATVVCICKCCIEIKTAHNETSVDVVKKHCCHQKCCGGMGCAVVQQACR